MELVLDASVVIKWFLEEKLSQKALELRRQHLRGEIVISAPPLLAFEIINALCTKSKVGDKIIILAVESFYVAQPKEYPFTEDVAKKTAEISRKYKISAYDASYLALAKTLGCKFVTADKKLYRKIKSLKFVELFK